jgi:hypothetical protein
MTSVDDKFGFERAEALVFHAHLNHRLPSQQARLLDLWDNIGLPYEGKKTRVWPGTMHNQVRCGPKCNDRNNSQ